MWQKFKEQIPAIIITAALVIGASVVMVQKVVSRQRLELEPLRQQNELLQAQAEENRRQIDATAKLLKDALAQNGGELFRPEANVEKLNEERLTRLAEVIAKRVIPSIPVPKSPEELAQSQSEQVEKVADRLAANIKPVLADAIADQKAASARAAALNEARVQEMNVGLLAAQAAAQDALRLSREVSALYVESFRDQGVLMRLFSLPANLVIDAANMNLVSVDKGKVQRELAEKASEIEKRLKEIRTMSAAGAN